MKKRKVAIVGCGAIFNRHSESILASEDFILDSVCDIQREIADSKAEKYNCNAYYTIEECLEKSDAEFYVLATPNSLHYSHAKSCIEKGKDILVEKPVTLNLDQLDEIISLSNKRGVKAYGVLQVRLNNSVKAIKECLEKELLGKIRGVSLIQRWQRPVEYFSGWRSIPKIGGGTLHEVGIHYIDILQYLIGKPEILFAKEYNTKHTASDIEDTVYSVFDYGSFGGNLEITISAEPHNLECSISILGSNGYIKLGGKALNLVESYNFLSHGAKRQFENILESYENVTYIPPNNYGSYLGSCPNHMGVYKNLEMFKIENTRDALSMIEDIYKICGRDYR